MEDSRESFMSVKTRDLMRRSWQSQANLSLFLCLLILLAFVIPSMGFEKHNMTLYEDMAVFRRSRS